MLSVSDCGREAEYHNARGELCRALPWDGLPVRLAHTNCPFQNRRLQVTEMRPPKSPQARTVTAVVIDPKSVDTRASPYSRPSQGSKKGNQRNLGITPPQRHVVSAISVRFSL